MTFFCIDALLLSSAFFRFLSLSFLRLLPFFFQHTTSVYPLLREIRASQKEKKEETRIKREEKRVHRGYRELGDRHPQTLLQNALPIFDDPLVFCLACRTFYLHTCLLPSIESPSSPSPITDKRKYNAINTKKNINFLSR